MKKFVWMGAVVVAAAAAVWAYSHFSAPKDYAVGSAEWKYYTAEAETKVRPAHFEDLKWKESDAAELRAPASKKKSR